MVRRVLFSVVLAAGVLAGAAVRAQEPAGTGDAAMVRLIDQVEIAARDTGVLTELLSREGQMVKTGELIGSLDDRRARIALQKVEHELAIAAKKADNDVAIRAAVKSQEVADTEYKRAVDARKSFKASVSQTEIDALRLKAEKAVLEIEQAREDQDVAKITKAVKQTEVEEARAILEQKLVIAPWEGMLVQVNRRVGDYLQTGDKVARLIRLDRLRIETFVREADLARARVDSPVKFSLTIEKQPVEFEGRVVFVSPEVDPVNGQVKVWAEIDNPDLKLRPGQRGKLTFGPAEKVVKN